MILSFLLKRALVPATQTGKPPDMGTIWTGSRSLTRDVLPCSDIDSVIHELFKAGLLMFMIMNNLLLNHISLTKARARQEHRDM